MNHAGTFAPQGDADMDVGKLDDHELHHWDDNSMNPRLRDAVNGVEDMVFSVLSQLATLGRGSYAHSDTDMGNEAESEETREKPGRRKARIELKLVDRSKQTEPVAFKYMKYPKRCARTSIRPLAQLLRVVDLTHEALVHNIPTTKRHMYYKDVPLFKTQRTIDSLVDDISATIGLERSHLNIRATSKGLVCGSGLVVYLCSGETLRINDTEGTLIPVGEDIKSFVVDEDVSWVLIIEKEAAFQFLCQIRFSRWPSLPGRGVIITGKGYPDIATRHLVRSLADGLPLRVPIVALVDGDPFGIDILSVYKFGSQSLRHEKSKLASERIEWLGLCTSELGSFNVDKDRLIPITKHDEAKALSILRRSTPPVPGKWRKEIMRMLQSRRKAEIEILSSDNADLSSGTVSNSQPDGRESANASTLDTHNVHLVAPPSDIASCSTISDVDSVAHSSLFSGSGASSLSNSSPPTDLQLSKQNLSLSINNAPLVSYLVCKITECVIAARAQSVEYST